MHRVSICWYYILIWQILAKVFSFQSDALRPIQIQKLLSSHFVLYSSLKFADTATAPSIACKPRTYLPAEFTTSQGTIRLLVNQRNKRLLKVFNRWSKEPSQFNASAINGWIEEGEVFPLSPIGTKLLFQKEQSRNVEIVAEMRQQRRDTAQVEKKTTKEHVISGLAGSPLSKIETANFLDNPDALEKLWTRDFLRKVSLSVAENPNSKFARKWIYQLEQHDELTSLKMALALHSQRYSQSSSPDGEEERNFYYRRAGYIGTLAPGANYHEDSPIASLPKRVLHPWPAVQEIIWHGRNPPCHPAILPTPVICGINGMLLEHEVDRAMRYHRGRRYHAMGASGISFTEAVWLWKNATIGRCYDPADQILHGGNVFNGHSIKGYTPDHPPTANGTEIYREKFQRWKQQRLTPNLGTKGKLLSERPPPSTIREKRQQEEEEQLRKERFSSVLQKRYPLSYKIYLDDEENLNTYLNQTMPLQRNMGLFDEFRQKQIAYWDARYKQLVDDEIEDLEDDNVFDRNVLELYRRRNMTHAERLKHHAEKDREIEQLRIERREAKQLIAESGEEPPKKKRVRIKPFQNKRMPLRMQPFNVTDLKVLNPDTFDHTKDFGIVVYPDTERKRTYARAILNVPGDPLEEHRAYMKNTLTNRYYDELRHNSTSMEEYVNPYYVADYAITRSQSNIETRKRYRSMRYKRIFRAKYFRKRTTFTASFAKPEVKHLSPYDFYDYQPRRVYPNSIPKPTVVEHRDDDVPGDGKAQDSESSKSD